MSYKQTITGTYTCDRCNASKTVTSNCNPDMPLRWGMVHRNVELAPEDVGSDSMMLCKSCLFQLGKWLKEGE